MTEKDVYELGPISNLGGPHKWSLGYYLCAGPIEGIGEEKLANQMTEINYTGKPGSGSGIFYSLFFQLPKWDWKTQKITEWIEVTPTHKEYYDRTTATKQMLESTIKSGLASASQSVSDYELLLHDLRKYAEIVGYFENKDKHSLKSIFIDQVDLHTGNLSIAEMTRNRWPTMTADFHNLDDDDKDREEIKKKLDISMAEAIILATKNKLYTDWKKYFGDNVKDRYKRLRAMALSREKSVEEYKEWLKPYISRFRMTKLGSAQSGNLRFFHKSYLDVAGLSTFLNNVKMVAWKPLRTLEFSPSEEVRGEFKVHPYDSFTRNNLILGGDFRTQGSIPALADIFEWLRRIKMHCPKCDIYYSEAAQKCGECNNTELEKRTYADELVVGKGGIIDKWKGRWGADHFELYYMFLNIDVDRLGIRLPGGELEDITFTNTMYTISQNVLLVKILELVCMDIELEFYIDEMLGFRKEEKDLDQIIAEDFKETFGKKEEEKKPSFTKDMKKAIGNYGNFFKNIKIPKTGLMFVKPGNYESTFSDRISKQYLKVAGSNFGQVSSLIKSKMGMV